MRTASLAALGLAFVIAAPAPAAADPQAQVVLVNLNVPGVGLNDPTHAENAAREAAVKALEQKAALYARATGHRVSRLVTLSEGGGYAVPPPMPMLQMARAESMDAATKVAPGELRVRIDVTGLYEITR